MLQIPIKWGEKTHHMPEQFQRTILETEANCIPLIHRHDSSSSWLVTVISIKSVQLT